jgi:hypothetical protein
MNRFLEFFGSRGFNDNKIFIVAVRCFRPEPPCLESQDASEGDTANEVVGCEIEGRLTEGTGEGISETVGW